MSCWRWVAVATCREVFARVDESGSPRAAVIAAGLAIAVLALIGNVELTWSFSAFTVLIYYAITNLAALRLPKEKQLYSPLFAWGGLAACLCLAFFVEREIWMIGLGLIAVLARLGALSGKARVVLCLLLAHSGRATRADECLLLGAKRTSNGAAKRVR